MSQPQNISNHYLFSLQYPFDGKQVVYPDSALVYYQSLDNLLKSSLMVNTQYVGNTIIDRSDGAIDGRLFRINSLYVSVGSPGTAMFSDNRRTYWSNGNPNTSAPTGLTITGTLAETLTFFYDDICIDKTTGDVYRYGNTEEFGDEWVQVYDFSALVAGVAPEISVEGTTGQIGVSHSGGVYTVSLTDSITIPTTYNGGRLNIGSGNFTVNDSVVGSQLPIYVDLGAGDRLKLLPGASDLSSGDSTIQWQHWLGTGNRLLGVSNAQKAYDTDIDPADIILGSGSEVLNNMVFWDTPDGNSKIKEISGFKYLGLSGHGFFGTADLLEVPNLRVGASGDGMILAGWVKTGVLEVTNIAYATPRTVTWANASSIDLTTGSNIIKIQDAIGSNRTINPTGLVEGANYIIFMAGGSGTHTVTLGSAFVTHDGGNVFTPESDTVYAWTGICLNMGSGAKLYGVVDKAAKNLLA